MVPGLHLFFLTENYYLCFSVLFLWAIFIVRSILMPKKKTTPIIDFSYNVIHGFYYSWRQFYYLVQYPFIHIFSILPTSLIIFLFLILFLSSCIYLTLWAMFFLKHGTDFFLVTFLFPLDKCLAGSNLPKKAVTFSKSLRGQIVMVRMTWRQRLHGGWVCIWDSWLYMLLRQKTPRGHRRLCGH